MANRKITVNYPNDPCLKFNEDESADPEVVQLKAENARLEAENKDLKKQVMKLEEKLEKKKKKKQEVVFSLVEIVKYCKERIHWSEVRDIVTMLLRLLRFVGGAAELELVDSIEAKFKQEKLGTQITTSQVTIQEAKIQGAMYEVKDNKEVNLR